MKQAVIFNLLIIMSGFIAFPTAMGKVPGILRPDSIAVTTNELYIVEGASIYIFNLKNLTLLKKFGKKGAGPGELMENPQFKNKLTVYPTHLLVETFGKLVLFAKDGTLKKEIKLISPRFIRTIPIGKNYVIHKLVVDEKARILYTAVALHDSEMKEIKELFRQEFMQQGVAPDIKINLVMDFLFFEVVDNKIFIEESPNGFIFEVFDSQGKKLNKIQIDSQKVPVTEADKSKLFEKFKADPILKPQGGWEQVKKFTKLHYSDYFPSIQNIDSFGNKIYIRTFKVTGNKEEYMIMDTKGKILKKANLQRFENETILDKFLGTKLIAFANDKLYYLKENEDEEEWELYMEEIK